jgi:hypothetical protein
VTKFLKLVWHKNRLTTWSGILYWEAFFAKLPVTATVPILALASFGNGAQIIIFLIVASP